MGPLLVGGGHTVAVGAAAGAPLLTQSTGATDWLLPRPTHTRLRGRGSVSVGVAHPCVASLVIFVKHPK